MKRGLTGHYEILYEYQADRTRTRRTLRARDQKLPGLDVNKMTRRELATRRRGPRLSISLRTTQRFHRTVSWTRQSESRILVANPDKSR